MGACEQKIFLSIFFPYRLFIAFLFSPFPMFCAFIFISVSSHLSSSSSSSSSLVFPTNCVKPRNVVMSPQAVRSVRIAGEKKAYNPWFKLKTKVQIGRKTIRDIIDSGEKERFDKAVYTTSVSYSGC